MSVADDQILDAMIHCAMNGISPDPEDWEEEYEFKELEVKSGRTKVSRVRRPNKSDKAKTDKKVRRGSK